MKRTFWKRLIAGAAALVMIPVMGLAQTATVKGGWLRLRAQPSFTSLTLASYYTGTEVTVNDVNGKWVLVTTGDGKTGYMHGDYLTMNSPVKPDGWKAYVYAKNGLPVKLRSGPGTGYSIITKYKVGTPLTILSRGTTWHYVQIGSNKGYMMASYISEGGPIRPIPPTPSESGYTAWITSGNGKGVNFRSAPTLGNTTIATYPVGTQVTVLQHGSTWDYVRIGNRKGYMMTMYLTTNRVPTGVVVTGVSLSTKAPSVGTTISASVIPANATVTYQWVDETGVLLASGNSYVASASDIGHKIRVIVSGRGDTTGVVTSGYTAAVQARVNPTALPTMPVPTQTPAPDQPTVAPTPVPTMAPTAAPTSAPTMAPTAEPAPQPIEIAGSVTIPGKIRVGDTVTGTVDVNADQLVYIWRVDGTEVGRGESLTVTADMADKGLRLVVKSKSAAYTGTVKSKSVKVKPAVTDSIATTTDLQ